MNILHSILPVLSVVSLETLTITSHLKQLEMLIDHAEKGVVGTNQPIDYNSKSLSNTKVHSITIYGLSSAMRFLITMLMMPSSPTTITVLKKDRRSIGELFTVHTVPTALVITFDTSAGLYLISLLPCPLVWRKFVVYWVTGFALNDISWMDLWCGSRKSF